MVNYPFVRVRTGISRGFVLHPHIPYIFAAFWGDHSLILQVYEIYEKDQEAARTAAAKASEDGDGEERPMQNDKFEIYHAWLGFASFWDVNMIEHDWTWLKMIEHDWTWLNMIENDWKWVNVLTSWRIHFSD